MTITSYKIISERIGKITKMMDKSKIHWWRKGKSLEIRFNSYYDAGKFSILLNEIGDENYEAGK